MSDATRFKENEGDLRQLISFVVENEEYGLEILRVKEVIRTPEITRLPKSPTFVKGIINLRGDIIPIVDLRDKFGLGRAENTDTTRVIVVDIDRKLVGIVVDAANQVVSVHADQIEPPPPVVGGLPGDFLKGVGKIGHRLIILLDIDRVLSEEEKQRLAQIQQPTLSAEKDDTSGSQRVN